MSCPSSELGGGHYMEINIPWLNQGPGGLYVIIEGLTFCMQSFG